jgi:hypothetical protein
MRRKGLRRRKNISKRILKGNKKRQVIKKNQGAKSDMWNDAMSFKDNFKEMGIMININKEIDKAVLNNQDKKTVQVDEEVDINTLRKGTVQLDQVKPRKRLMNIDDKWVVEAFLIKYTEDEISKMFRDLKLNKFQWNKTQIKKKLEEYKLNYGEFSGLKKK